MSGQTEIIWGEVLEAENTVASERRQCQLGDLVELVTKGTTPSTLGGRFVDKGINFIKSEAIGYNGRIDKSTFVRIDEATHAKLKRSQLKENDILFSMAGIYLGKNAIVTKDVLPANTNQALAIIRLDKAKADTKFIHYYLKQESVTELVNNMSGQSAQPNINFQEIRSIDILLPDLEEQRAIARVLSSLDEKIDLLNQQNATLENLAETLFRQWFVEEAKEDWKEGNIYSLIDVVYGFPFKSKYFNEEQRGLPLIRIRDLKKGYSNIFTDEECDDRFMLLCGDLVAGMDGEFRLYVWSGVKSVLNQRACKFRPKFDYVPNFFVFALMKPHLHYYESTNVGTTVIHLGKGDLDEIKISIPPIDVLKKFGDITNPMFEKLKSNFVQLRNLEALRDTLLPKLMSGEVRVAY